MALLLAKWKLFANGIMIKSAKFGSHHHFFMETALSLARRALGRVAPSAAVGCVIVQKDTIVGRGWTQPSGRPHAEAEALNNLEALPKNADCYVTLEPCVHTSTRGPNCVELLQKAKIKKVYVAVVDPDPRMRGQSVAALRMSGIEVEQGLLEDEARALNVGYFKRTLLQLPFVTLKLATSADGKIASADGLQTWITGKDARTFGHRLRATHDAVLTGIGTVLVDNPSLTCRLPGCDDATPIRIVLDTNLRILPSAKILQNAHKHPVWLVSQKQELPPALAETGAKLLTVASTQNIYDVMQCLAREGITRLLTEAGSRLNASLLEAGCVDEIAWFSSPTRLGINALPAFHNKISIASATRVRGFEIFDKRIYAPDTLYMLRPSQ